MLKKYLPLIVFLALFAGLFWSVLFYPSMTLMFTVATILFYLSISISSILERYKGTENQRQKIIRDILVLIFVLIFAILLGGWSGTWVGRQAGPRFGIVIGILCGMGVSFAVGYLIRKGVGRLFQ